MVAACPQWAQNLLETWFEELGPDDWFRGGEQVDRLLSARFESVLDEQAAQPVDSFLADPLTARAAILLFDQVPRNLYRDSARAFAYDPLARMLAHAVIARGWDEGLPNSERQFVAMPLMHSEELADQEASLAYFAEHLPGNLSFARKHHEMIARFGRFPHRNELLGRETTPEEQRAIDEGFSW
ncbi:DUF924 domain-containing protein [Altererythrobacter arenosus]|uniref:DUF924 domain-containing protein n=1 Tax=Altererythrobacter arenosus TaxID=3032592 RepID=A0ABY8FWQ3_9SPHN|nr:DUF924 family protein [Altererythrobacter sp. CAU 1644]WFL78393.1 DUF924 domain-containing protein [Altererythrobacter sp. CAU 1644]